MRLLLKILMAPIVLALTLFVWICSGILYCSAYVFGLAGTVAGILGVITLFAVSVRNGVIVLILAWLISPLGIPMLAVWLVGKCNVFRWWLKDRVYG